MVDTTVGIDDICQILAGAGNSPLTQVAISQFVKAGMPKADRGKYDPLACSQWYIGILRASLKNSKHGTRQTAARALGLLA